VQATNKHNLISQCWALDICEEQQATISLDRMWNSNICCPEFLNVCRGFVLREVLKGFANWKGVACPTPLRPGEQVRWADEIAKQAAVLRNRQQMLELVKTMSENHIKDLNVGGNEMPVHW